MSGKKLVVALVAAATLLGAAAAAWVWMLLATAAHEGDRAVARMTAAERRFLADKLERLDATMTRAEVTDLLGPPDRGAGGPRPTWVGPGGGAFDRVAVYFRGDHPTRVRWLELGWFVRERDFAYLPAPAPSPVAATADGAR